MGKLPTKDDAYVALEQLNDLLSGFEFATPVDRSAALSGLLTTVVRPMLPTAPMHLIRGTAPGVGKSHLVDVASAIATGRICPVITSGKTLEETEKRLGALLLAGVQILSLDNCIHDLEGDLLCQITERPLIRFRPLGVSEIVECDCRTIVCNLGANVERPELRRFGFDPVAAVLEDRGKYLWPCYQIMRAYIFACKPEAPMPPLGSYDLWSSMARAPLIWLGEEDPVKSMDLAREQDPVLSAILELFGHWRQLPPGEYTALKIVEVASRTDYNSKPENPEFRDLLIRKAGERGVISTRRLSTWLRSITGRVVDGMRLQSVPGRAGGHAPKFFLEHLNAQMERQKEPL